MEMIPWRMGPCPLDSISIAKIANGFCDIFPIDSKIISFFFFGKLLTIILEGLFTKKDGSSAADDNDGDDDTDPDGQDRRGL